MKLKKSFARTSTSLICAALVTACGGGSSSGGSGSAGSAAAQPAPYAGTYQGTFDMAMSARGVATPPAQGTTTIVVNNDNSVVVDPGPNQFPGTYDPEAGRMLASFPGTTVDPSCTGDIVAVGNYAYDPAADSHSIDGRLTDHGFACRGVPIRVTGTFQTNKVNGNTLSRSGTGMIQSLRNHL